MHERTKRLSRRSFLFTAGAGGAVVAAAIVARNAPPGAASRNKSQRASRGYHATEHVNNYYQTAKV